MNRPISFRAWDGERMKEVTSIGWIDGEIDYISTPKISASADNFVLMQYTGLKDKNGKEIYEGDILRWRDSRNLEIKWGTVGWVLYGELFKKDSLEADSCNEFNTSGYMPYSEIIGNIYQDSHLLDSSV